MKKAQIKMFETIGVLVVFFMILVVGAVIYFNIQKSALEKEVFRQAQLASLKSAQRAAFLPELDCSFYRVTKENCIDRLKLSALKDLIDNDEHTRLVYFKSAFGYMNLTVRGVYPEDEKGVNIYEYQPEEYTSALKNQLPVLLYDPVSGRYSFGVMEVTTYAAG
ncbi:MAG: hypothetical protein QXM31_02950 [Candidatus Woesearchaeota archaeon]